MDHYVDIDVQPDPEFPAYQLIGALYSKLHRALVARNSTCIGVSFPGYSLQAPHLGKRLRLHGDYAALSALLASDWLAGMRDHIAVTTPARVPGTAKYCRVTRVQVKSSPERLRRRLMRRHDVNASEAHQKIPNETARIVKLPFVHVYSASTGQTFKLFINHSPPQTDAIIGDFNTYGLSQAATIPWF